MADAARARRSVGTAATLLAVVGLIALVLTGDEGGPEQRLASGRGQPASTTTVVLEAESSTTLGSTTTLAPPIARPTARRSRPAPAPGGTGSGPTPGGLGTVLAISSPGIYALDVQTGGMVRLGDAAPFDVAGTHVLTLRGADVVATPAAGGSPSVRYAVPLAPDERLEVIEAAPDGAAIVRVAKPVNGGTSIRFALMGPAGEMRTTELTGSEFEWSGDGSSLVVFNWLGVTGYRPDGTTAWGPVSAPESLMTMLRVNHDGSSLVGQFDAHRAKALDVATGRWSNLDSIWRAAFFGSGRRLMAQQSPPPGWNGRTPLPTVVFDPVTGSVQPYAASGSEPSWAPDEGHAVLLGAPLDSKNTFANYSFTVRDRTGNPKWTLSAPGLRFGRDDDIRGLGPAILGPQWTTDGRHLVVGVS